MRRAAVPVLVLALAALSAVASSPATGAPPVHDPAFLKPVPGSRCTPETPYERSMWRETVGTYGKACKRMRFTYGPIVVKPGQNSALIGPVSIEKPGYDGYVVRFKPDLVDASGEAPPIEIVHLHHATWLNAYPQYGNGPFFAAGEEKTIGTFPKGYGMHVGARDSWLLLFMVHSAVSHPTEVWVTYDIDFVAEEAGKKLGIVPVKPIWLDVQHEPIAPGAPDTSANPVYNVHRGFGHYDKRLDQLVCTWPKENCARHDVYGDVTPQQGKPVRVPGADWKVTKEFEGTLIGIGGHLHPGGIDDTVSLVRGGKEKPIFISEAVYWDRKNPSRAGGPMNSWDFSMTVTGAPIGWKVKIKAGDIVRLNATYDSQYASWYENMGIVVALLAPKDPHGPEGVDVFEDKVRLDTGAPVDAMNPEGYNPGACRPDLTGKGKTLCLRGAVTHGHLQEASRFGGCPPGGCDPLPKKNGRLVTDITMQGFTYGEADLGVIGQTGVPRVERGETVRFWNPDTAAEIWHTVTRCKEPCTGEYGLDYPLANGGRGPGDRMDFDSTEVGYGLFYSPASGQIGGDKSTEETIRDGVVWEFTPTRTGTYAFFCRIHPGMRGAIRVVK